MELWIRSQDGDKLLLVKELYAFSNESMTNKIYKIVNNYNENLGIYKTKQRALEVLDEIQKFIERGCKEYKSNGDYYTSKYEYSVFQMPQD